MLGITHDARCFFEAPARVEVTDGGEAAAADSLSEFNHLCRTFLSTMPHGEAGGEDALHSTSVEGG